jgi:aminoglycoside phosphotransferase (APT) family kinase protein
MDLNPAIAIGTPSAELAIDAALVQRLLASQHADLMHLPIQLVDAGWDNVMFRLGDQLAVRLPRRKAAVVCLEHEQTWLPQLAPQLPIAVPTPYRFGQPTPDYPWPWSVLPWLPGTTADQAALHADQAIRLATFLRALHRPAPAHAPHNPMRGVPLRQRAPMVEDRLNRLENQTNRIPPPVRKIWQQALSAPIDVTPTWLHGDLHPRNVLVHHGTITGIIDWGDITAGDRATDLAAIWMLFADASIRQTAIAAYGNISPATRQRAQGWAILFGSVLLDSGLVDQPRSATIGESILQQVAEDG